MATSFDATPAAGVAPSPDSAAKKTLIFLHIPKAAGTTMASILTQQYGKSVSHHTKRQPHQQMQAMPEEQRRQLRLIHGHMPFGIHQYLSQSSTYFTMLRHPVERVISHYYFILNSPEHSGYPVARAARNITQYVACGLQEQTNNVQTRHISGIGGTVGFGKCTARHLQQAKQNLEAEFILAGTSEQFDATLLLLGQRLGWTPSPYPKLNVNPSRRKRDELSRQAIAMIERHNALDLELYRYVTERLQQQIAAQGPEFQTALSAFQQANLDYGEVVQKGERSASRNNRPAQAAERNPSRPNVAPIQQGDEVALLKAQLADANQTIAQLTNIQARTQQQLRKAMAILAKVYSHPLWPIASKISALRRGRR